MSAWFTRYNLPVVMTVSLALAWMNRWVQDDAFISFRYAQNFAQGYGLVWNTCERIEGYSNFLWTIFLAPAFWVGWDIVQFSYALSLLAFACTLWCCWQVSLYIWKDWRAGCLAVFLLGTNFAFSSYATGGLETQFATALAMGSTWMLTRWLVVKGKGWVFCAAMVSACAVMTRMDTVLLLIPLWLVVMCDAWRENRWKDFVLPGLVGVGMVVTWLLWRHGYYGAWVPNTALIKIGGGGMWIRGLAYIGLFYGIYGYVLAGPFCLMRVFQKMRDPVVAGLICAVALWHLYVISIGGDFMEFRMMMSSFPLVLAILAGGILSVRCWPIVVAGLIACSVVQGTVKWDIPCVETKHELRQHVAEWKEIAEALNTAFGADKTHVKIGVSAAGVIPFYTEMPALDLLGLNDREVAIDGNRMPALVPWLGQWPGHVRMAKGSQVLEKGVHLLLNNPWVVSREVLDTLTAERVRQRWMAEEGASEQRIAWQMPRWEEPHTFPVVAWPCGGNDRDLITLYVLQNDRVDEAIQRTDARVMK